MFAIASLSARSTTSPRSSARRGLRLVTQNWQFSTVYQIQSGMPFTISVFGDTANSGTVLGENPIRANYTGQPIFGPGTRTANEWFNPGSFRDASGLHVWGCRTQLRLRTAAAYARYRDCPQLPPHRAMPISSSEAKPLTFSIRSIWAPQTAS